MIAMSGAAWAATQLGVEGSVHDFSFDAWNVSTRTGASSGSCNVCHAAHNTDPGQIAPLWRHGISSQTFTPYENSTFQATTTWSGGRPNGPSLACLSCHDGVTALNSTLTSAGTSGPIDPAAAIGTDLHTTHPISFTYDAALATLDGELEDPTSYVIGTPKTTGINGDPTKTLFVTTAPVPGAAPGVWTGTKLDGQTIDEAMLFNGKMECSSCHDVHKMSGSAPSSGILLRISGNDADGRASLICRTCHIK
jgi:hypothetical protein